jgi:glycosyltransferase involved in cell wall biosynthesis
MIYPSLSIIIPCYNEKNTIKTIIEKVIKVEPSNKQIIVVDDYSNDGSIDEIKKIVKLYPDIHAIFHDQNFGKGKAIRSGIEAVKNEVVIIQDADLEYDPSEYSNLMFPFVDAQADIVYGSRFLGNQKYTRIHFFWHYLANKTLTFISNIFTNLNMTDMETGFKAFKSSVIKSVNLEENSFGIEPEMTIKLSYKKFKFYEVPISYNGRSYEEGKKIRFIDAFVALYCIFKYSIICLLKK